MSAVRGLCKARWCPTAIERQSCAAAAAAAAASDAVDVGVSPIKKGPAGAPVPGHSDAAAHLCHQDVAENFQGAWELWPHRWAVPLRPSGGGFKLQG
eukprot:scaffold134597_cov18-Tisochrysis_lutea.AAC.1